VTDLIVVGPDPQFGGGSAAHVHALVDAARGLGLETRFVYVPHPALRDPPRTLTLQRLEAFRIVAGSRSLVPELQSATRCWVAGPLATHGYAAALSGRRYSCWAGTSLADENAGRDAGLAPVQRLAMRLNAPILSRIERTVLQRAARVYATGESSRRGVAAAGGLSADAVGLLPLPVDPERFFPASDQEWLTQLSAPRLVVVGRVDDPRRNVALALEALPLIRARLPGATLRVVGPGRVPGGSDAVELLGEVEDVGVVLRASTLLLLPSRQEGFGIVAAEALASGVPVVATPSGGPEELLAASGGGVITSGWTAAELADRVLSLLADVATLTGMRRRGREYVLREHTPARLRERLSVALEESS
jgi:glycosyltransferase involved in cell wall biosynthesis